MSCSCNKNKAPDAIAGPVSSPKNCRNCKVPAKCKCGTKTQTVSKCACKDKKPSGGPSNEPSPEIVEKCKELNLTDDQIKKLMDLFLSEVKAGLSKAGHDASSVKCFITYVQDLPNGSEEGKFLAMDLGDTKFRVLVIELSPNHFEMQSKVYPIPQEIKVGTGKQLFDHIADCLAKFMEAEDVLGESLPLGFTFGFALRQVGLAKGIMERWSKEFNCSGVVGNDVVQLLNEAIARRGDINVEVSAILNDTTGTLMSCAWEHHNCKVGIIIGTGTNACYMEKQSNCEYFDEPDNGSGTVLVNTEWAGFGENGIIDFVRTSYDLDLDKNSSNPGHQLHEKMISGMYLGELVRLVIVRFTKENLLLGGKGSDMLFEKDSFPTTYLTEIESDPPGNFDSCKEILEKLDIKHASEQDCASIRYICECISKRAAHLVSAAASTLINKMDDPDVMVGIDGPLYKTHPHFHDLMMEKMTQLVKPGIKFDIVISEDGNGRGAALVAAVATRK